MTDDLKAALAIVRAEIERSKDFAEVGADPVNRDTLRDLVIDPRRAAQSVASRLVRKTFDSRTPRREICARHLSPCLVMLAMRNPMGNPWGAP